MSILLAMHPAGIQFSWRHGAGTSTKVLVLVLVVLFLVGLAAGFPAVAATATMTATLDRRVLALGDTASLKISITGGTGRDQPVLPSVNGIEFAQVGNSMSLSFVNGRQSVASELTYSVTPSKIGDYTLAPITAVVGGQTIRAATLALKVVAADDPAAARNDGLDKAAFLNLVVPKRDVYVGETFIAEIQLYAIGGRLQQGPQIAAEGFIQGKLQDGGQEGNIRTNNRIYTRARFLQTLTAARSGDLQVQARNCILDLPIPRRFGLSDPFDDVFGLRENRRFNLSTPPSEVTVLPLPSHNVPAGFSGAVGDFAISLTATPTNVQAGDPVTLRIEISGTGNFDGVQLSEQQDWRGFRVYPPTASFEPKNGLGIGGVKRIEQVVTPETTAANVLPPLSFSFFHPPSGTYRTVQTEPVSLRVTPGAAPPPYPGQARTPSVAPAVSPEPELASLKPHLGALSPPALSSASRPWFLALNLVPAALWIGARIWRRRRERMAADRQAVQRQHLDRRINEGLRTLAQLVARHDTDAFFATLFRVLQEAVAHRTGLAPASITEGVLDTDLPSLTVAPEVIDALHRLFQACNQARYARAATQVDLESLRADAETVCATLRGGS